jgi:hypothetical protein
LDHRSTSNDLYDSNEYDEGIIACANALAGKVVAKEDLLTANDVVQILVKLHNRNFPESDFKHEYKETCSCNYCMLSAKIVEAQQRKANCGE